MAHEVIMPKMGESIVEGTIIDWKKSIMGETFVFSNPNATSKCGCGSSFGA